MAKLDDMTKEELYALAQDRKIKGRASMDKDALHKALKNDSSDRGIRERSKDELVAWVEDLKIEDAPDDLDELPSPAIIDLIVAALPDDELKALPEVTDNDLVRDHRDDWEAAARGDMVEAEREQAARDLAEQDNIRALQAES